MLQEGATARVVVQDSSYGDDGGLVVVPLRNATTTVYLRPPTAGDPCWRVVFEPQHDETALTAAELHGLVAELAGAVDLCVFLTAKSPSP